MIGFNFSRHPEPVLQETKYAAIEIQPWTYITEKATYITLSPPVRTDYAKNLEIVLQKTEYAAAEIHPCTYVTETATNIALSPPVSTDYAENQAEYAAAEIQPHHGNRNRYIHVTSSKRPRKGKDRKSVV